MTSSDFAVDRAIEVADGLDRFDLAERLAGLDLAAGLGQLDVDQVGQGLQGEGRRAHGGDLSPAGPASTRTHSCVLLYREFLGIQRHGQVPFYV